MALGFTIPLFIVMGALSIVALLLLGPRPVNKPAIELAKASCTPYGKTVMHTFAAVLVLLLASPVYDAVRLYRASRKPDGEHFDPSQSVTEAETMLSLVMIISAISLLFILRKLGCVMGDRERMSASEAALLKQVRGLQAEYQRVTESGAAKAAPAGSEEESLRRDVEVLRKQASAAEERAADAVKAQRAAEANLAALKAQAGGLEKEYDRLLAEHGRLQRELGQATGVAVGGPASKKDE